MTATLTPSIRRRTAVTAMAAALAAVITGCASATGPYGNTATVAAPSAASITASFTPGVRVVLQLDSRVAAATLADTPASKELAARLPLTVEMSDTWGQAKAGRLPHPVPVDAAARTLKPTPGGIYYWPDTATLAVYYDDLGQSVPPPGLIHLGEVDTGVDEIADSGRHLTVRIDRAADIHS